MYRDKMSDDMEVLVRGSSGFNDVRKAAEKDKRLTDSWLQSENRVKGDLEDRIERLALSDKPFKVHVTRF